jgi:hypothetical protein
MVQETKVDEGLRQLEAILEEYTASVGVGKISSVEVERYLSLSPEQLKVMSPEDCGIASHMLAREATYLQKQINRHTAILNWANTNLSFLAHKNMHKHLVGQFAAPEQRRALVIAGMPLAQRFQRLIKHAKIKLDSISYLPQQIRYQADMLRDIAMTKRTER